MGKKRPSPDELEATRQLLGPTNGVRPNAHLVVFGHGLYSYALAYKCAADKLVDSLHGSSGQDVVFPLCYLYRHHLELMVKQCTRTANYVLHGNGGYAAKGHDLTGYWKECRSLLERAMSSRWGTSFDKVEECIAAFSFDFEGELFRYPEDVSHSTWEHSVEYLNLRKMLDSVSAASDLLDSMFLQMNEQIRNEASCNE
ncbi:MAG TPA: hypothetical protein VJY15_12360 [Candidatus Acidoferrum sp.]|nr:hypothetical protein [Candidatus Acidoferrum sp.]